jgi:LAO/AO transport system kinase
MEQDIAVLFEKMIQGDRVALGQAITLVESERYEDRRQAVQLLEWCEKRQEGRRNAIRYAISGSPGAGKSTLIESLGQKAIAQGHKVGVITVDPTSSISRGSILGDKSRMTNLSVSPNAFIRSSAAGSVLGGMGRRSYEMMSLLSAVGYDIIFMETVGVGQSEHIAWRFTDGFILVLQPGGGDELQGIKRGITELADIILVSKADGSQLELARLAKNQYQNALHYFSALRTGWIPKILTCSALTGEGIDDIWEVLRSYQEARNKNISAEDEKKQQKMYWLTWSLGITAHELLMNHPVVLDKLKGARMEMTENEISLFRTEFEIENVMKDIINSSKK